MYARFSRRPRGDCFLARADFFGTLVAGTWAHLKRRGTDGAPNEPVVKFSAKADIDKLEKSLRAYMYAKVPNDMNTKRAVERSFADFDTDNSKCVSINEFISALERYGLHVAGRRPGAGGLPMSVVQGLFDKYDTDSSGSLNYKEFTEGLFSVDAVQPLPPAPQGKRVGKRDVCEDTAYLKMSNHIFGGRSREEGALTMDQMKEMRKGKF
jgi:hypothetical protein